MLLGSSSRLQPTTVKPLLTGHIKGINLILKCFSSQFIYLISWFYYNQSNFFWGSFSQLNVSSNKGQNQDEATASSCLMLATALKLMFLKLNMQRRRSIPNGNTKNWPSSSTFCRRRRTWSFHVVVLQRTAKKCTKIYNARAQLLFYSLNLLFRYVLVAVGVVVCLSSLI